MKNYRNHTPDGVVDILEQECLQKRQIEEKIRAEFASFGYFEIESPTYEFYDVFEGELSQEELVKFFDKKGRILALRPDITTPISRIVANKCQNDVMPKRLCYVANAFRGGETFSGTRQHEFTQAGIELVGINSPEADGEVICLTISALQSAGLTDFLIELGHADFFKGLADQAGIFGEELEKLRVLVDNKDSLSISDFVHRLDIPGELKEIFEMLPQLYGDISVIDRLESYQLNEISRAALLNIRQVYDILKDFCLEQYLTVDLGMVNSLDYYTGIIFKGVTRYLGLSVCGGGRYDNLSKKFGASFPATGVAIGINRLMSALWRQNKTMPSPSVDALVAYSDGGRKTAFFVAKKLREQGLVIEVCVGQEAESYAKEKQIGGMFYCRGDKDITAIDFVHGSEKTVTLEQLLGGGVS